MPLIVMCGLPSSGKTSRVTEIQKYFEQEKSVITRIVCDEDRLIKKNEVYSNSTKEKELRSNLKSEVQRLITKDDILILDSMNYIKGFRYELYCVSKSAQTPHCVIYCATDDQQVSLWNSSRLDEHKYTDTVLTELLMRFEAPDSSSRWDSPLFVVMPHDSLPFTDIHDALYLRKPPPPNLSTLAQPLSATNFLHELDTVTQSIIVKIAEHQKTCVVGDALKIPGAVDKLEMTRLIPMNELQRLETTVYRFH